MCLSIYSKPRSMLEQVIAKVKYKVLAFISSQFELEALAADRSNNKLTNET